VDGLIVTKRDAINIYYSVAFLTLNTSIEECLERKSAVMEKFE